MDSSLVNAVTNCGPANSSGGLVDKSKEWQMEMLMEKLRCKAGQFKSFFESAKALRMSLLEKRYPVDSMERNQLYKCLDTIQQNIKVTSLQAMVERLESVSRQLGLKFMAGPSGLDWFISSDMFYLEVVFETNDTVKDVKIHHEGKVEQQSCEELVSCLTRRDFSDFTAQLEGLASIYQLNAEKKVKCKAFSALQSLEADLATLSSLQSIIKEPLNLVHKSPVGVLQKRRGGHPMKLTYFVSPYDLLDPVGKVSRPLSVDNLDIGNSVTVCIEGSLSHKLQTSTLITVNSSGKNLVPVYGPLTNLNSANLPACFVLKLSRPMPICVQLVRKIEQVTEIECGDASTAVPLLSLIVQHANLTVSGTVDPIDNKGLFVNLPDQVHCYFMTENHQLQGIVVSSIPFTHPAHVPQILVYLRQQALLNTIVTSCVRSNTSKQVDLEKMIMMEVTPLSYQQVSISLEHPIEESMATAELDLSDITNVTCKMYNASQDTHTTSYVTRVLQRSLSLPITMRALIRCWQHEASQGNRAESNGILGGGGGGGGGPPGGPPGSGGSSGGGSGSGNMNGGGGSNISGNGTEHDLNIKPDPDMMQTDCGSSQMMTDSNIETYSNVISSSSTSLSFRNTLTAANEEEASESAMTMDNSPSPQISNIVSGNDKSIFSLLAPNVKPLNIDLLAAVNCPDNNEINVVSNNDNNSSNDNNICNVSCKNAGVAGCNDIDESYCKNDSNNSLIESTNEEADKQTKIGSNNNNNNNIVPAGNNNSSVENINLNITGSSSSGNNLVSNCNISGSNNRKRKWKQANETCNSNNEGDDEDCEILLDSLCANEDSNISSIDNNSKGANASIVSLATTNSCNNNNNNSSSAIAKEEPSAISKSVGGVTGEPEAKVIKKISSLSSSSSTISSSSSTPTSLSQSPSSILLDLENKNLVPPSVSITPIPTSLNPVVGMERRPGIEIIPLTNPTISSSITITPITATKDNISISSSGCTDSGTNSSSGSSRKSSKSSDDKDRKRKRRKEDTNAGMGPPTKQDPLLKPVSVSIKPADCGSPCPSSPSTIRTPVKSMKHSLSPVYSSPKSSPKHGTSSPGSGKPSMSALKSAVNSPKSDGSSKSKQSSNKDSCRDKDRKSSSSGSCGSSSSGHQSPKLKSSSVKLKQLDLNSSEFVTSSCQSGSLTPPSGSSGDSKSQPQVRNRKGSLSAVIDKLKSAQHCTDTPGGAVPNDSNCSGKSSNQSNSSNCSGNSNKERNIALVGKSGEKVSVGNKQPGDSKVPGEYMVKHSSDVMKITINKTRTKESAKSSNSKSASSGGSSHASGSGSPKTHTGLKPGVNSGPASKKPQQTLSTTKSASASANKTTSKISKSVSPSNIVNKSMKSGSFVNKDSKQRTTKSTSSSTGSIFSKSESKKLSPSAHRDKEDKLDSSLSLSGILPAQLVVEGLVKPFDPSFQIPKLSARNSSNNNIGDSDGKKPSDNNVRNIQPITDLSVNKQSTEIKNFSSKITDDDDDFKSINLNSRNDIFSCKQICNKKDEVVIEPVLDGIGNLNNNNNNNNSITSFSGNITNASFGVNVNNNNNNLLTGNVSGITTGSVSSGGGSSNNISNASSIVSSCVHTSSSSNAKTIPNSINSILESSSIDLKKISSAVTTPQEAAEILLDISASLPISKVNATNDKHLGIALPLRKNTPPPPPPPPPPPLPPPVFPASPSVQVHIVKSPAPSPLVIPSPHSASPCITDDELMDEALVGIGK